MPRAILTVDLGFGDAGKGTTVDALVSQLGAHHLVVRYNGGAQAAHTVVRDDGVHHVFAQFGSGTFHPGCRTLLARDVKVNPLTLMNEAAALEKLGVTDALDRMYIDRTCLMTTPYHRALNRIRELARGSGRHGSCGMGVGETVAQALRGVSLRVGDITSVDFASRLDAVRRALLDEVQRIPFRSLIPGEEYPNQLSTFAEGKMTEYLRRYTEFAGKVRLIQPSSAIQMIAQDDTIFEGAQGVLLDEDWGFHPYTTWSHTTLQHANELVEEAGVEDVTRLGITRSYSVRHGPGPLPSQSLHLTSTLREEHNEKNAWQGEMRCGHLDVPLLRYAVLATGPLDGLAVTHLDRVTGDWLFATEYDTSVLRDSLLLKDRNDLEARTAITAKMIDTGTKLVPVAHTQIEETIHRLTHVPVVMSSYGPRTGQKSVLEGVFA